MIENYSTYSVSMEDEIWKDIKGYEGIYEISNFGRVRQKYDIFNVDKNGNAKDVKLIKPDINFVQRNGYLRVDLSKCGITKHHLVHRLVAEAFMPNPYNLPYINHKDENRSNSRLDNLEWCTHKYNANYGTAQQRKLETRIKNIEERSGGRKIQLFS